MLYKPVIIREVQEEIPGFHTYSFEPGHGIEYEPGQYLTFVHFSDTEEIRRSYSIISSPYLKEPLAVGIKRIPNGAFSRRIIDHAKPGDILMTTGAGGLFTLPPATATPEILFFFAAGSGITPVYSLFRSALILFPKCRIILFYSNSSPQQTIFYKKLTDLQKQIAGQFEIHFMFSDSPDLSRARLNREFLSSFLSRHKAETFGNSHSYICGPESYMRMCLYTLQEHGFPRSAIRLENFITDKPKPAFIIPPDNGQYNAIIEYGEDVFELKVPYPDSILSAAKKKGIILPYSCEAGRCGNCVAKCEQGTVWMSYNEVLTEEDLQNGLILTCTGHPQGGDVKLRIS